MKKNKLVIMILLTIFSLVVINCSTKSSDNLKADISVVNGIKVINNPSEPLYGELDLKLSEELTIGHKEVDFLNYVYRVDVDKNENIYILDFKEHKLKIYDKNGNFIRAIGQKGQGPGDLYEPSSLDVDEYGRIYITDHTSKTSIFNFNGDILGITRFNRNYLDISHTPDGNFICMVTIFGPRSLKTTKQLIKVTPEGDIIKEYISKNINERIRSPEGGTLLLHNKFSHKIIYYVSKNGALYLGDSSAYKIFVYGKNDRLIKEILKDEPLAKISREEKNKQVEHYHSYYDTGTISRIKMLLPDYKPFFFDLLVDDKERLFVFKRHKDEDNAPYTVDIFDKNGQYAYRTVLQWVPKLIHNGYLYIEMEEKFDVVLKKFEIKGL